MYNDIIHLLNQRRLKEGLTQLKAYADKACKWELQSRIENLQTTYQYMLQYAAQGLMDPARPKLFNDIRCAAYEIADQLNFLSGLDEEYGDFADKFRTFKIIPPKGFLDLGRELKNMVTPVDLNNVLRKNPSYTVETVQERYHLLLVDELFNKTWVSTHWTWQEYTEASQIACELNIFDMCVWMSGVTLNLLHYFDPLKFYLLLNVCYEHKDPMVQYRALVGIALSLYYYEDRIALYPDQSLVLAFLLDQPHINEQLQQIQLLLLLSRETEKIDKKMREEILPKMFKRTHLNISDKKISKIELEDLEEINPEWQKDMDIITEHMRELGELQRQGADTYMSTFSQLKNYKFFNETAHWFYPFNKEFSEVKNVYNKCNISEKSLIGMMLNSATFCNSDKYSFCFTLNQIPEEQMKVMGTEMSGEGDFIGDQLDARDKSNIDGINKNLYRQYLQDLYRFFKLWKFRKQQHDIYTDDLLLWKSTILKEHLFVGNYEKEIANHLLSKGYLSETTELYEDLSNRFPNDTEIRQKLGFIYQKQKNYEEAIQAYGIALVMQPTDEWTLKHIGQCYKRTHQYQKALEYFKQAEALDPDDLNLQLQIGQCYATLQDYNQALSHFFKVEYLGKASENARRAIGWCYFMTGKYDKAVNFYEKIINEGEPKTDDWLNYGHVRLAMGQFKEALKWYRRTAEHCETHEAFVDLFIADKEALLKQDISEDSLYIVQDLMLQGE